MHSAWSPIVGDSTRGHHMRVVSTASTAPSCCERRCYELRLCDQDSSEPEKAPLIRRDFCAPYDVVRILRSCYNFFDLVHVVGLDRHQLIPTCLPVPGVISARTARLLCHLRPANHPTIWVAKMMHPARQAYVEEDAEVSLLYSPAWHGPYSHAPHKDSRQRTLRSAIKLRITNGGKYG